MINGRMNPIQFIFYSDKLKDWKESSVMSVDGVIPVGLNLSHWPGNRTPERFRAKTTTEMVMKLNGAWDRADILEGVEVVTNNHYDTDGFLSVLGIIEPDFVDIHKEDFMEAAESGDFQRYTSDIGLKLDLLLANYSSSEKSPFYEGFRFGKFSKGGGGGEGVWEVKKRQKMYEDLLKGFKGMVGGLGEYEFLYGEDYRLILEELSDVVGRKDGVWKEEYSDLGLSIFGSGKKEEEYREFVVNSWCEGERILEIVELGGGQYGYELRYTVDSWFDLEGIGRGGRYPRRSFLGLCEELNGEEGEGVWSYEGVNCPTPGLRNGRSGLEPREVIRKILRFFG